MQTPQQDKMMDGWEFSAMTIIRFFQAICRGQTPLHMSWDKEAQEAGGLTDENLEFIKRLQKLVGSRGMCWSQQATIADGA